MDFNAKKLEKALNGEKINLGKEAGELYDMGKKLSRTRLVDSKTIEVDPFFAETLKEKLYYDWTHEQNAKSEKRISRLRYAGALAFSFAIIVLLAFLSYRYFTPFAESPKVAENEQNTPAPVVQNEPNFITATLAYFEGRVELWENDAWVLAEENIILSSERQLRTLEASKAILSFEDGSAMRLDQNTHVIIEDMTEENIILQQIVGKSYSRVNKSSTLAYTVRSLNTQTTALGTAFTVEIDPADPLQEVNIKALESSVKIKLFDQGQSEEKHLLEGEEANIVATLPINQSLSVRTIIQEELQADFFAWNRSEDEKTNQPLGKLQDIEPPALEITNPANGLITTEKKVFLAGRTDPDSIILLNDNEIPSSQGQFLHEVDLALGENIFHLKTFDSYGNVTNAAISVIREPIQIAKNIEPAKEYTSAENKPPYLKKDEESVSIGNLPNINLSATPNERGVYLSWSINGLESLYGFKILKSQERDNAYAEDESYLFPYSYGRHYFWPIKEPGTYNFSICQHNKDGSCGIYSNNVKINID